jgi:hypothetical protein
MRYMIVIAVLAAIAALTFGALATRISTGDASAVTTAEDRGAAGGVLSYRARVVIPAPGHARALRAIFARTHTGADGGSAAPLRLLEARHVQVLWALATFQLADGSVVAERFSRRRGQGWRDLGATRPRCPAVPPEVRGVWHLLAC